MDFSLEGRQIFQESENDNFNWGEWKMEKISPPPPRKSMDAFTTSSFKPLHGEMYDKVIKLILESGLFFNSDKERRSPPYRFKAPEELRSEIDFPLKDKADDEETLLKYLSQIMKYSPHHSHPFHIDKIYSGLDPYAMAVEFVVPSLSCSVTEYVRCPVYSLMEIEVKRQIKILCGYKYLDDNDGVISAGCGHGNLYALRLALHHKYPGLKENGFDGNGSPKICIFTSMHGSRSTEKAAIICGIGSNSVIYVATDNKGRMDMKALDRQYDAAERQGYKPLMIVASAGTNNLGAIDPIDELGDFCKKKKIWLHINAAYAAPFLLSERLKLKFKGVEKSDSICWSNSSVLGLPVTSSIVIVNHENIVKSTFYNEKLPNYSQINLTDPKWDEYKWGLQTTRRPEIVKFWFTWKIKGKKGLASHVNYCYKLAQFAVQQIGTRKAFGLIVKEIDTTRVGFYYIPKRLRYMNQNSDGFKRLMQGNATYLKAYLLKKGVMQIGVSQLPETHDFFTMSITNSALTKKDVIYILDAIEYHGDDDNYRPQSADSFKQEDLDEISKTLPENFDDDMQTKASPPKVPDPPETYPSFVNSPIESMHKDLFVKTFKLITKKCLYFQVRKKEAPLHFKQPKKLMELFDFKLRDEPGATTLNDVMKILKDMVYYTIHTNHPYIFQRVYGAVDPYSIMADWTTTCMRGGFRSYEDSPVYFMCREEFMKSVESGLGFSASEDTVEGVHTAGGTMANMCALHLARYNRFPRTRVDGMTGDNKPGKLTFFGSIYSLLPFHYYGLQLQGFGAKKFIVINIDKKGKMNVEHLKSEIRASLDRGETPFIVVGTAGVTSTGAIDPLVDISDVCRENGLWFHVDGAFGGTFFPSKEAMKRVKGIEKADSVSLNGHKMYVHVHDIAFLLCNPQHDRIMKDAFHVSDPSTYPPSPLYDSNRYDGRGFELVQTEKRGDILNAWFSFKAKGISGVGKHIDYMYALKDYGMEVMKKESDKFVPFYKQGFEAPVLCFHYVPKSLRNLDKKSDEYKRRSKKVTYPILHRLIRAGIAIPGLAQHMHEAYMFKFDMCNSGLTKEDIKYVLKQIDNYGQDLKA